MAKLMIQLFLSFLYIIAHNEHIYLASHTFKKFIII